MKHINEIGIFRVAGKIPIAIIAGSKYSAPHQPVNNEFLTPPNMSNTPEIKIACVANLFSRMMWFPTAGCVEEGHTHSFDHLTLLAKGKLRVYTGIEFTDFSAPTMIYIHKDINHKLESLENETVAYCIHALRDGGTVSDILAPEMLPDSEEGRSKLVEMLITR